jgi:hypothetical protein
MILRLFPIIRIIRGWSRDHMDGCSGVALQSSSRVKHNEVALAIITIITFQLCTNVPPSQRSASTQAVVVISPHLGGLPAGWMLGNSGSKRVHHAIDFRNNDPPPYQTSTSAFMISPPGSPPLRRMPFHTTKATCLMAIIMTSSPHARVHQVIVSPQ